VVTNPADTFTPPLEGRAISKEAGQLIHLAWPSVCVEDLDVRATARTDAGHDFGFAIVAAGHAAVVAAEVGRSDIHAAVPERPTRIDVGEKDASSVFIGPLNNLDVRATAWAGSGDDVALTVAVGIADGHKRSRPRKGVLGLSL